ncbi:MAG: DUF3306 domain-containing protein [Sterolibacterium sp.]|jgi:hypothetical protein
MKENFLQRWSRLKRAPSANTPPAASVSTAAAPGVSAPPVLPALDSLEFSSDFSAFMADEVEDGLRRVALQKLFHTGHFNVMDGLDVYTDDYNSFEPIGEELLRNLNQARGLLFDDEKTAAESMEAAPLETGSPRVDADQPDDPPASQDIVRDEDQ